MHVELGFTLINESTARQRTQALSPGSNNQDETPRRKTRYIELVRQAGVSLVAPF